jgi:hypothetical protein
MDVLLRNQSPSMRRKRLHVREQEMHLCRLHLGTHCTRSTQPLYKAISQKSAWRSPLTRCPSAAHGQRGILDIRLRGSIVGNNVRLTRGGYQVTARDLDGSSLHFRDAETRCRSDGAEVPTAASRRG